MRSSVCDKKDEKSMEYRFNPTQTKGETES